MIDIRQAKPSDLQALYQISIETGHAGVDARQLYSDQKLIGHVYSAPYLVFEPDLAIVATKADQVVGYCVGTSNTTKFEATLEQNWWPSLREKYAKPDANNRSDWTGDERLSQMIHMPEPTPTEITNHFPAHIHMNLCASVQGQGIGSRILAAWLERAVQSGVAAVHLGADPGNSPAIGFWKSQGFDELNIPDQHAVWMGRRMP